MSRTAVSLILSATTSILLSQPSHSATVTWDQTAGFTALTNYVSQGEDGTLTHLRIDPIAGTVAGGQANQEFAFDYVRISTIPEPSAALLSGVATCLLLLRRRRN